MSSAEEILCTYIADYSTSDSHQETERGHVLILSGFLKRGFHDPAHQYHDLVTNAPYKYVNERTGHQMSSHV